MPKPKKKVDYKTYYVTETIYIQQQVIARSKDDAEKQYLEMMKDPENRVILTEEGATSSSSTCSDIVVRTPEEQDEHDWELENEDF